MAPKQLISQSSKLSEYDYGVRYYVKRRRDALEVSAETANKLADTLIGNQELKFIKIKTTSGIVVLNVNDIVSVEPNEERAKTIIRGISDGMSTVDGFEELALVTSRKISDSRIRGKDVGSDKMDRKEFEYFHEIVLSKQIKKLSDAN